jgi:hypothetical protein
MFTKKTSEGMVLLYYFFHSDIGGNFMASLLLSLMVATCILVMMDCAVGTRTMALTTVFISSVYLLVFYCW